MRTNYVKKPVFEFNDGAPLSPPLTTSQVMFTGRQPVKGDVVRVRRVYGNIKNKSTENLKFGGHFDYQSGKLLRPFRGFCCLGS
jgi:hypothetical protein